MPEFPQIIPPTPQQPIPELPFQPIENTYAFPNWATPEVTMKVLVNHLNFAAPQAAPAPPQTPGNGLAPMPMPKPTAKYTPNIEIFMNVGKDVVY